MNPACALLGVCALALLPVATGCQSTQATSAEREAEGSQLLNSEKRLKVKKENPDIKVMAVEPPSGERVEGLRSLDDGYIPPVYEKWGGQDLLDGKRIVRPKESIEWMRRLTSEAGIFAGISSGAALAGAARVAERIESGVIVFVVCDGGWKYLSTGAWTDDIDEVVARAEQIIYF